MTNTNPEPEHASVMPNEVLECLDLQEGATGIDGTTGLGGHSRLISELIGESGHLICLDRDAQAQAIAKERLSDAKCHITYVQSCFSEMRQVLDGMSVEAVDFVLLDIGVSSMQLDLPERGFSFRNDGPLDMRMDQGGGVTAEDIVMTWPEADLARIFWVYGEERFSRQVAKRIVEERAISSIKSTGRLAEIVSGCVRAKQRIHPATRVFQALRIAVNDELGQLERGLEGALKSLKPGGRFAVIAFHSLEDRMVKRTLRRWKDEGLAELPKRKAIKPSTEECEVNRRSRSARLRFCVKV